MVQLGELVAHGANESDQWHEILAMVEQRRKLVESEAKRLKDMQQMITTELAMVLVGALQAAVQRHVTDRNVLAAIAEEFRRIVG